jgi:hypothetical protein
MADSLLPVSSLESYRTNLGNIVRPNKFIVTIQPPTILTGYTSFYDKLKFHVKESKIPSRTVGEYEMKFHGQRLLLQGDTTFEDLDVKILNEDSWKCRSMFEDWQNLISNITSSSKTDLAFTKYKDLTDGAYVIVDQYNFSNEILASYKYFYVFPKSVSGIDLSTETKDSVEEFDVSFGYSYWKRLK